MALMARQTNVLKEIKDGTFYLGKMRDYTSVLLAYVLKS
jgi:hypothetical protein